MSKATNSTKRMKSVTRLPGWWLKIKGRMDSRRGQGVCDKYIEKLHNRLGAIESLEVIKAENLLHTSRKEAAVLLSSFSEKQREVRKIPTGTEESTAEEIRVQRERYARYNNAKSNLASSVVRMTEIQEQIVNTEIVMDERINKTQKKMYEKISTYVEGIRCGRIKEYEIPEIENEDRARQIYYEKHSDLDTRIREIVQRAQSMEVVV